MIAFTKRPLLRRAYALIWPPERRRQEEALESAIRELVLDPDMPCIIDGVYIPSGRGEAKQSPGEAIFGKWK